MALSALGGITQSVVQKSSPIFVGQVPLPPGINHSYQIVYVKRRPRLAKTPELALYEEQAVYTLYRAHKDSDVLAAIKASRQHTPLAVTLNFYFETMWRRDIDGPIKAVLDVVFHHLGLNDNLITELHATKGVDRADPRVEVSISCLLSGAQ